MLQTVATTIPQFVVGRNGRVNSRTSLVLGDRVCDRKIAGMIQDGRIKNGRIQTDGNQYGWQVAITEWVCVHGRNQLECYSVQNQLNRWVIYPEIVCPIDVITTALLHERSS